MSPAPWVMAVLLCSFGQAAQAQGVAATDGLQRRFEMPAHHALIGAMQDSSLSTFETDGCSGGMSWSWRMLSDVFPRFEAAQGTHPPWEHCCIAHDRAYHYAGGVTEAEASYAARLDADAALRHCVASPSDGDVTAMAARYDVSEDQIRFAHDLIATSMYRAVRFGGGPCTGLPWRWGFGYPACLPGF